MRTGAVVILGMLAMLAAAGCGGGARGGNSDVAFPAARRNPAGLWDAPVNDMAEARRLCDAAMEGWPDAYAGRDRVTFEVPNTGIHLTCVRQR